VPTANPWEKIKAVVGHALELEPGERTAYLDLACAEEPGMRAEVESLLAAHGEADGLSVGAGFKAGAEAFPPGVQAEQTIGPYVLVRELGAGGMGQVWLAQQTQPVRRRVALKVIRAGIHDTAIVQRFFYERQSLAQMEHPAIARVFDAGTTAAGQPYLVMEFVDGLPITEYCDTNQLGLRERLGLFLKVCEGVQHAHQKAIIHRDLKPSNILVVEVDGKPQPRIIDFGLAKTTVPAVPGETLYTQVGAFLGTPGYMSPEQADPAVRDIDTRTDVYSLGVILYELLTGTPPFETQNWKQMRLDEVLRQLRESDPPRPSTRVSENRTASTAAAEARAMPPFQLVSALRGDLDWITMKALEKDRDRRYGSPSELAADVERHLEHRPVMARPAGHWYELQKYVRRHRTLVGATAAAFLLLAAFATRESLQARRIARERDRANQEAATAKETADFLVRLFEVTDPSEARGKSVTAYEILNQASKRIDTELQQPSVRARLELTMARAYKGLGLYQPSVDLAAHSWSTRRSLLGENDAATLESRSELGDSLRALGKKDDAETQLRATLDAQRAALGADAQAAYTTMARLGVVVYLKGDLKQAEALLRESSDGLRRYGALATAELVGALQYLGSALRDEDKREDALKVEQESLNLARKTYGPDHPTTLSSLDAIGLLYWDLGRLDDAESYLRQSLDASRRVLGPEHPDTLTTQANLGLVFLDRRKYADAEAAFRATADGDRKALGPDHEYTLSAVNNLCAALRLQAKYDEAERYCREALDGRRRTLGEDNPRTLNSLNAVGSLQRSAGHLAEAETTLRDAYERRRKALGPDHADTIISMGNLGEVLLDRGKVGEAAPLLQDAAARARATVPATDLTLPNTLAKWGRCQMMQHHPADAKATLARAVDLYQKIVGAQDDRTQAAQKLLAKVE
jgi:non-specific serine/threonine protein kinase/serine/threonine-protein kinase